MTTFAAPAAAGFRSFATAVLLAASAGVAWLCPGSIAWATADPPTTAPATQPDQPKTGRMTFTFTDRSPVSSAKEISDRTGWSRPNVTVSKGDVLTDYQLADESFEAYVPESYTGAKPFGLLVFINPGGGGGLDGRQGWKSVIDQHELIWVGPNRVQNGRSLIARMGLAIDAAVNMQARYKIDPQRVYVFGVSGGGRVSSMLGVAWPDVFRGGLYIVGADFYLVEHSNEQNGDFPRSYLPPPKKFLDLSKKNSKHVFLTGDNDGNREQTQVYYEAFKRSGFEHCTYFQVPGMGHQSPPLEWFEKAITALDERLPPPPGKPLAPGARGGAVAKPPLAASPAKPAGTAVAATRSSTRPAAPAGAAPAALAEPDRLLAAARLYAGNRMYPKAREKLRELVELFPNTPAAKEGKRMLAEMPAN